MLDDMLIHLLCVPERSIDDCDKLK